MTADKEPKSADLYIARKSKPPQAKKKRRGLRISLIVGLTVLFAASLIVVIRWKAWFGNESEQPYSTPATISRICLVPGANFATDRTISWRCDTIEQPSFLEYQPIANDHAIDPALPLVKLPATVTKTTTRGGKGYYYHVKINGLVGGQSYRYRVISGEQTSPWYHFALPSYSDNKLSFLYLGDLQDATGYYTDSILQLLYLKHPQPDFIALGGDQIERPMDKYWHSWFRSMGAWAGSVPLIATTGNHEYIKGLKRRLDERWIPQFNYPENGPKGYLGRSYFIDFPLMRFVVIDTNDLVWPTDVARHSDWLKEALDSASKPWKVVMFHHAAHSVRSGRLNIVSRFALDPILKKHHADLVLQGHDHAYARMTSVENSGQKASPVYIISSASPKVYRNGFDKKHDRIGSGMQLYQIINLTPDSLCYQSFLFDGTLYDSFNLTKKETNTPATVEDKASNLPEIFFFNDFGKGRKAKKKQERYKLEVEERESGKKAVL